MFRSDGTAKTTATMGTVTGTTPTQRLALARVVSPSVRDSTAGW